jgi:hypothetical protein
LKLIVGMIAMNPTKRLLPALIKDQAWFKGDKAGQEDVASHFKEANKLNTEYIKSTREEKRKS